MISMRFIAISFQNVELIDRSDESTSDHAPDMHQATPTQLHLASRVVDTLNTSSRKSK
jgi:hypothetical protein